LVICGLDPGVHWLDS